jgi:uncharacterized protein YndB with AHSA1/START domain
MKGTLHHDGNRHTLRFECSFAHPPEKVWRTLTETEEMAHWFPAEMRGPREPGAKLRFVFPSEPGEVPATATGEGPAFDGEMIAFDPPRLFEFSWGGEVLRFELAPQGDGTLLVFTHTFEDLAKSARDASGWDFCLAALESRLSGQEPGAFNSESFETRFGEYARLFGPEASVKREPGA